VFEVFEKLWMGRVDRFQTGGSKPVHLVRVAENAVDEILWRGRVAARPPFGKAAW
jgi:hypothetical protein